jgi:aspartate 1-decarboxylase
MFRIMCKSKIRNAEITELVMDHSGSIGIDSAILAKADILEGERVQVLNLNTGVRFETYVIAEDAGSKRVVLYGPAARLGEIGDPLTIISYVMAEEREADRVKPKVVDFK